MDESIFENICKDDFYFINKHDVNWLVIKNHMGKYMYYDVDEIEKTGKYKAYEYDKNAVITHGITKRSEKLERDKQERAQQNLANKVHEDLKKSEDNLRNNTDYVGEDYNNDEINRKLGIESFLKKYNIEERFEEYLNGKLDNIGKKLIEKDNGIEESFKTKFDGSYKKIIEKAIQDAKESYKGIKDGGEKTDKIGNKTKFLADIARKYVFIASNMEQLILNVLMRRDKKIEELKKKLTQMGENTVLDSVIKLGINAAEAETKEAASQAEGAAKAAAAAAEAAKAEAEAAARDAEAEAEAKAAEAAKAEAEAAARDAEAETEAKAEGKEVVAKGKREAAEAAKAEAEAAAAEAAEAAKAEAEAETKAKKAAAEKELANKLLQIVTNIKNEVSINSNIDDFTDRMKVVFKDDVSDKNDVKKLETQKENLEEIENDLDARIKGVSSADTMKKLVEILEYVPPSSK